MPYSSLKSLLSFKIAISKPHTRVFLMIRQYQFLTRRDKSLFKTWSEPKVPRVFATMKDKTCEKFHASRSHSIARRCRVPKRPRSLKKSRKSGKYPEIRGKKFTEKMLLPR